MPKTYGPVDSIELGIPFGGVEKTAWGWTEKCLLVTLQRQEMHIGSKTQILKNCRNVENNPFAPHKRGCDTEASG